jgi:hypothetical protein
MRIRLSLPALGLTLAASGLAHAQGQPASGSYGKAEAALLESISAAATCRIDNDCVVVAEAVCPYGCVVVVNRKEAKRLKEELAAAPRTCAITCPPQETRVSCEAKRCVVKAVDKRTDAEKAADADRERTLIRLSQLVARLGKHKGLVQELSLMDRRIRMTRIATEADRARLTELEEMLKPPPPPPRPKRTGGR